MEWHAGFAAAKEALMAVSGREKLGFPWHGRPRIQGGTLW